MLVIAKDTRSNDIRMQVLILALQLHDNLLNKRVSRNQIRGLNHVKSTLNETHTHHQDQQKTCNALLNVADTQCTSSLKKKYE